MKRVFITIIILLSGFSFAAEAQENERKPNLSADTVVNKSGVLSKLNLKSVTEPSVSDRAIELNNQGIKKALAENNYPESVAYFRQSVEIAPDCRACRYNLAMSLLRTNKAEESLEILQKLVEPNSGNAEYLAALGEALSFNERFAESVAVFERAAEIKPTDAVILNNLGNALYQTGQHERALKYFASAVKIQPDLAAAYSNRGAALFSLGRYRDSIENLRRAVALEPDSAEANNNLGVALSQTGKKKEAYKYFTEALRLRPNWSYALFNLATYHLARGDRDAARAGLPALEKADLALADRLKKMLWQKYVINAAHEK